MGSLGDVDARHLSALVAVVEEGTFARAAATLGFTQSAVSQQIAQLERAAGVSVFDRQPGPRPVRLTPAGRSVLAFARRSLAAVAEMDGELDRLRRGVTGRLVIGTFQSFSSEILPAIVGTMRRDAPEVDLVLVETDDVTVLRRDVLAGDTDLAFTIETDGDPMLRTELLGLDPFVVIAPVAEATGSTATPADLDGRVFVGQALHDTCQLMIDDRLAGIGVRPEYGFRFHDNGAVQSMVRSGMGWSVMPSLAVNHDDPGIVVLELDPPIAPRSVHIIRARDRTLPGAAERFVEIAREVSSRSLADPDVADDASVGAPGGVA